MLSALNLRHLRALSAIARLGSISAAAQAVSVSQPAITQGITKLERTLGVSLFDRQPGGMAPTSAANVLVPRIDGALAHIGSSRVTMTQMQALLALAEAGSYASAAASTGLAQPSLHRAIADLALALRRPLVERRGKGVSLTDTGRRTVRAFRLARAELLAGVSELEALKGFETGRIAIGAMPLARARVLPAAVAAFCRDHPDVQISIIEGSFAELIEPLRDGDLDVMIGALRDPAPGADVEQSALFDDLPVVLARKNHPLSGKNPDLAALARYQWIVSPPPTPLYAHWARMFTDANIALPHVPIDCGSVITIRQILLETDYLTILSPDQVAVELEADWLDIIARCPSGSARTIGMTVRSGWRPTARQSSFIEVLKAKASPL
jgi:LysR family transcriptional regulator, regulator for genes of the gallate degradation pathway